MAAARETMLTAREVLDSRSSLETFDARCIERGINPGSIADITIASIYIALGEGWSWDS
jgi:triphosphoribosyl-dephospho-CoA synthase